MDGCRTSKQSNLKDSYLQEERQRCLHERLRNSLPWWVDLDSQFNWWYMLWCSQSWPGRCLGWVWDEDHKRWRAKSATTWIPCHAQEMNELLTWKQGKGQWRSDGYKKPGPILLKTMKHKKTQPTLELICKCPKKSFFVFLFRLKTFNYQKSNFFIF